MREFLTSWRAYRAVIAVIALYAFALQVVLGGAMFAQSSGSSGVVCLHDAVSLDGVPAKPQSDLACLDCCTVGHTPPSLTPPLLRVAEIVWPSRKAIVVSWRPEVIAAPRAPPGISASARGPPAV